MDKLVVSIAKVAVLWYNLLKNQYFFMVILSEMRERKIQKGKLR